MRKRRASAQSAIYRGVGTATNDSARTMRLGPTIELGLLLVTLLVLVILLKQLLFRLIIAVVTLVIDRANRE